MNRLAALIARLETLTDAEMKAAFVADYLNETPEPDRVLATVEIEAVFECHVQFRQLPMEA